MTPHLYIIRHGKTTTNSNDNSKDPIRSWSDPPLDAEGRKEAAMLGKLMRGRGIRRIFHSDLGRAHETARIIAEEIGAQETSLVGLRPWNLGVFIGHPLDKNLDKIIYYETHRDLKVPGGETYNTFLKRFGAVLEDAKRCVLKNPDSPIALVTHSQNLVALRNRLSHNRFPIEPTMKVRVGEVIKVSFPAKTAYKIRIISAGHVKASYSS